MHSCPSKRWMLVPSYGPDFDNTESEIRFYLACSSMPRKLVAQVLFFISIIIEMVCFKIILADAEEQI